MPQGGLEILCKFVFCADTALLRKLKKLVQSVPPIQLQSTNVLRQNITKKQSSNSVEPAAKKLKVDVIEVEPMVGESFEKLWLKFGRHTLTMADMNMIEKG